MSTNTPRTDEKAYGGDWEQVVGADFARTLERELAEAQADKARIIAVVVPHIADLRGVATVLRALGYKDKLSNTLPEIEIAANELQATIDTAMRDAQNPLAQPADQ